MPAITRIDTTKAEALPGVFAVLTHADVPEVRYGGMVQDRLMFAKDAVRFEARHRRGVAALTAGDRRRRRSTLIEVDYEPLPANSDIEAALATGRRPDPRGLGGLRRRRDDGPRRQHARPLDDHHAATRRGDGQGRRGRQGPLRGRLLAGRPDRAARDHRAVAGRQGHRLVVHAGAVRRALGRRAPCSRSPSRTCGSIVPLLGGGFGSKCDFHFEGHVAALARAAQRPVKLVFSRHEEFIAPDHRREGMVIELETGVKKDGTIVARRGRLVLDGGAYCGEGGFFAQMAAMHAIGPVPDRERRHRLVPGLHEQPAVELDPRPHGAAGLLGRRAAHGRGRRGDRAWTRSSCAGAR